MFNDNVRLLRCRVTMVTLKSCNLIGRARFSGAGTSRCTHCHQIPLSSLPSEGCGSRDYMVRRSFLSILKQADSNVLCGPEGSNLAIRAPVTLSCRSITVMM
jgi:hypothetical protein